MPKRIFLLLLIAFQPAIALAVPDEIYVDPAIAADSGAGTIGDPYGDVQYALDNINHGGDGARINVKTGTAEVLASGGLTLATYHTTNGAPGATEPIIIQGYTSAAGDGGVGEFTGTANSAAFWVGTTTAGADVDNAAFVDLKITTAQASGYAINIDNDVNFHNVELISNHGGIDIDRGIINRCNISYVDSAGVLGGFNAAMVVNSVLTQTSGALVPGTNACSPVLNNIFNVRSATDAAVSVITMNSTGTNMAVSNTIVANFSGGSLSSNGIRVNVQSAIVTNNYIEGFNGTNDEAIDLNSSAVSTVLANNAFYNNTASVTDAGLNTIVIGSTTALGGSGVVDASAANYTPTSYLQDAGYPSSFLQLSGNANDPDIGAIQIAPSGGGGGTDQITIVPFYGSDIQLDSGAYPFEFNVYQNGIPFALVSGAVQGSLDSGADAATGLTLNTIATGRYEVVIDSDNAVFDAGGNLNLTLSAGTVDGSTVTNAKVGEVSFGRFSDAGDIWDVAGADPTSVPGVTDTFGAKINWLFAIARNKKTVTDAIIQYFADDGTTVIGEEDLTDNGTTYTEAEATDP